MVWTIRVPVNAAIWRLNWKRFKWIKNKNCHFGINKAEKILEQIINELKCANKKWNIIDIQNLTQEVAIKSIKTYEIKIEHNIYYNDFSEKEKTFYNSVTIRNINQLGRSGRKRRRLLCI